MAGASLACALGDRDIRIALINPDTNRHDAQPSYDDRGLALSLSSRRILENLDVWPGISAGATAIRHVHISDRGHFGCVRLHAADLQVDALGYVVIARELGMSLFEKSACSGNIDRISAEVTAVAATYNDVTVTVNFNGRAETLSGRLLVVADGTHSKLRQHLGIATRVKDYGQTALVANVTLERPHADTAYERFAEHGPIALLPRNGQRAVLVYTVPTADADNHLRLEKHDFLERLMQGFGRRLGRFSDVGTINMYPLRQLLAEQQTQNRVVLLGNSSHTIHPNGAQGFNLCLRDVAALAEHLIKALRVNEDIGAKSLLDAYLASRERDQRLVTRFSDSLAGLFYNRRLSKVILRNTAMLLVDIFPLFKRELAMRAMGISGRQPAMVSGAWE